MAETLRRRPGSADVGSNTPVLAFSFSGAGLVNGSTDMTVKDFIEYYFSQGGLVKGDAAIIIQNTDNGEKLVISAPNNGYVTVTDINGNPVALSYASNGKVQLNSDGNYVNSQRKVEALPRTLHISVEFYGQIGSKIGSTLGSILAHGNKVEGILYSSVLGTIGKYLAVDIANGIKAIETKTKVETASAFNNFGTEVGQQINSSIIGSASSILTLQLAQDLGLSGFGAELFNTVGSSVVGQVLSNAQAGKTLLAGFKFDKVFDSKAWSKAATNKITYNAIGEFLGAKLGGLIVQPQTQAAAVLSGLGSSIGAAAMISSTVTIGSTTLGEAVMGALGLTTNVSSWLFNLVAPGIGSFVGFVLGALVGNLFGHKKPKVPTAGAETILNLPYAQYKVGNITSSNGGSTNIVVQMAQSAAMTLNGVIDQVTGGGITPHFVSNSNSPTQTYGYTGSQLYVKLAGVQYNFSSADQAVDKGVLWALPQTQIIGGDIFAKRAIKNSLATDIVTLLGDIQTAKDYGYYGAHRDQINSYITGAYSTTNVSAAEQTFYANNKALVDKVDISGVESLTAGELTIYNANTTMITHLVASLQNQGRANPWILTIQRATELNLDQWSKSDFYGGLQGFLQSFGMGQVDSAAHYEDISLSYNGSNLTVINMAPGTSSQTTRDPGSEAAQVYRLYKGLLGRVPDAAGWTSYVTAMESGVSLEALVANVLASAEFASHAGTITTNTQFVNFLCNNVLQRTPPAADVQAWVTALNNGQSRASVAMAFTESVEFKNKTAAAVAAGLTFNDRNGGGLFSVLAQADSSGHNVTINSFATTMGYVSGAVGAVTSTNTIEYAAGSTSTVTISNAGHAGYNIFVGGNGGNNITAGTNDTWIQGGSGTDTLRGGAGHDVIIAGSGSTTIYGGNADSYLAAGSGTDTITGGSGNDTIVMGSGHDTIAGGAGNDLIIYTSATSGTRNGSIDGGAGSNTLSFERSAAGVNINLGAWVSPAGTSYTLTNIQNLIGSAAGGNTLKTGGTGGTLEGGLGNDTFIGVAGGTTTVSFANSGAGVYIDLAAGISMGGSANDDTFSNIRNLIGSGYDDVLRGVAGSRLDGGTGGNDRFIYSGGGNTFAGSVGGISTVDYSLAGAAVTANFTTGVAQVAGKQADSFTNVTRIVGSRIGNTITGLPAYTTTTVNGVTTQTATNSGIYFIATGGTSSLTGGGYDTVEMNRGSGTTNVFTNNNSAYDSLVFGAGITYDNLWAGWNLDVSVSPVPANPGQGYPGPTATVNMQWLWGIKGGSDVTSFYSLSGTQNPKSIYVSSISMDGASTLDLSGIGNVIGSSTTTTGTSSTGQHVVGSGDTRNYAGTVANGSTSGGIMIITNGLASTINVSSGAATTNGSIVIAGKAGAGGITINTSSGDDQFTFERTDGHYTINGTGGQKTIAFGPSVDTSDVIYQIVGNDLYVGVADIYNSDLTASQVSDYIRIVGGALGSVVSGAFTPNNPYFVQVGGTTVDLSKIGISYKLNLTTSQTFTANDAAITVGNSLTETITGSGNVVTGGTGDTIKFSGAGNSNTVNMSSGTVQLLTAGESVVVTGNNDTITVTGSGSSVTVHGTGEVITASNTTIYKGNTSTATITGTGNTVVTLGVAPIVLDLTGDGLELTPVLSSDVVTTASNGALTRLGWVGPTNGILVTDRNGDGQYGDVRDISFVGDKDGAATDLEGLAGWDSNGDGVISADDAGWSQLKVWVDSNLDGISTPDEVKTLDDLGIASIGLQRTLTGDDTIMTSDSYASATSTFTRTDGTTGTSYDVTLGQSVLSEAGWTSQYGVTADQLSGGLLGHIVSDGDNPAATDISYEAAEGMAANLAAIWDRILNPSSNENSASVAASDVGEFVQNPYANRGAHLAISRMQVLDLDLAGFGPSTIELGDSTVKQDVGLTGNPQTVGWVGSGDGMLVIDAVDDGDIDAPTEATFQNWIPYARTSLEGLSAFDTDGDGVISAGDAVFDHLRIWTDANSDGVSQSGELKTMADLGVQSFSLEADWQTADTKTLSQNQILASSVVTMTDGSTHTLYDIALAVQTTAASDDGNSSIMPLADAGTSAASLGVASDASGSSTDLGRPEDTLSTELNGGAASVATSRGSDGPSGEVVTADVADSGAAGGWWQGSGQGLSDAIDAFNAGAGSAGDSATGQPMQVAAANDAAMVQRHLLLRQAIAGFTVQAAAPAVFNRQGSLDTQASLAAATKTDTPKTTTSIAA